MKNDQHFQSNMKYYLWKRLVVDESGKISPAGKPYEIQIISKKDISKLSDTTHLFLEGIESLSELAKICKERGYAPREDDWVTAEAYIDNGMNSLKPGIPCGNREIVNEFLSFFNKTYILSL